MNPIKQLIESIQKGDAVSVSMLFDKLMAQKLTEAIEDKKIEVVESIFISKEDRQLEEEFEQLDELSKTTLGHYLQSNRSNTTDLTRRGTEAREKQNAIGGIVRGTSADSHLSKAHDELNKDISKLRDKKEKRDRGFRKAISRLTKEEVEEFLQSEEFQALDELSGATLGKYIQKAREDQDKQLRVNGDLDKAGSRLFGINKAVKKLTTGKLTK